MQQGSTNINFYDASYLQAYANGSLSHAAMHAMEKAALNDPFLAEAMDGYLLQEEHNKQIALKTPVEKPKLAYKKFNYKTIAAAAGIFLVLGAAAFMIFGGKQTQPVAIDAPKKENDLIPIDSAKKVAELAKVEVKLADTLLAQNIVRPSLSKAIYLPANNAFNALSYDVTENINAPITTNSDTAKTNSDMALNDEKEKKDALQNVEPTRKEKTETDDVAKETFKKIPGTSDSINTPTNRVDLAVNETVAKPTTINSNANTTNYAAQQNVKVRLGDRYNNTQNVALLNNFNGRIVDNNNSPLAFARISLPEKGIETYADSRGYYNFESLDTNLVMNIKAKGQTVNAIKVRPKKNNLIVIDGDVEEDLAKGKAQEAFGKLQKKQAAPKMEQNKSVDKNIINETKIYSIIDNSFNALEALPEVSNNLYEMYLNNNTIFDNKLKNITRNKGTIVVSFELDAKGQPFNFKILQELTKIQNDDIIRLIKNGPLWKPKPNIKTITVQIIAL